MSFSALVVLVPGCEKHALIICKDSLVETDLEILGWKTENIEVSQLY